MKFATPRWRTPFVLAVLLLLVGLAPSAAAASASATAAVSPARPGAGTTGPYTYTLTPTSGQTGSFNLTAPTGWSILSLTPPVPAGVTLVSNEIRGRGLTVNSSSSLEVRFSAQAPCVMGAGTTWLTVAKTGGTFNGSSVNVNAVPASLADNCTAVFVEGRGPADAALNGRSQSEPITSEPYTPSGDPMQVEVRDADGNLRGGITVELDASGGGGSEAAGDTSETTGSDPSNVSTFGIATFGGPVTLANIGQGYIFTPTGAFDGVPSAPFGIYQEGEACATSGPCVVHGHNGNNSITTTVSALGGGELGTFVSNTVDVLCAGYTPLTADSIVWKYTGGGSQTIVVDLSKKVIQQILDRGSDHLNFCFDSEGKPFTDKFGVDHWGDSGNDTNGLLSDCNTGIDPDNCIVSETGINGGGRRLTVIVADGRGKI